MSLLSYNAGLRVGKEETWGVAQVGTTEDVCIISAPFQVEQAKIEKSCLTVPVSGVQSGVYQGARTAGGNVTMPLMYDGLGTFLEAALGNLATVGPDANSAFQHAYTTDSTLPSLTIMFQRGTNLSNSMEQFTGMKVSVMEISAEANGEVIASFDMIGKDGADRTTDITITPPAHDQVYAYEAGSIVVGGTLTSGNLTVDSMSVRIDNKLARKSVLGSKLTGEPIAEGLREVTMQITADVDDNAVYADSLVDNNGDVSITFTRTADANHYVKFTLHSAQAEGYTDSVSGQGRVKRTWSYRGFGSASNSGLLIEVNNANSSGTY